MDRKMIYFFSLIGIFFTWGVFGSMAATPRSEPHLQATVSPVENTAVPPERTNSVGIPITGEPEPLWADILGFYGLIGVAALFLVLALLNFANKSMAPIVGSKDPPSKKTH